MHLILDSRITLLPLLFFGQCFFGNLETRKCEGSDGEIFITFLSPSDPGIGASEARDTQASTGRACQATDIDPRWGSPPPIPASLA
jgi:hypothetical protein